MLLKLLLALVKFYQKGISVWLPARCRYYPTCSQYAYQALSWHGVCRGLLLTIWRLLRCQPFGGSGLDFVPIPLFRYRFVPARVSYVFVYPDDKSYKVRLNYLMAHQTH